MERSPVTDQRSTVVGYTTQPADFVGKTTYREGGGGAAAFSDAQFSFLIHADVHAISQLSEQAESEARAQRAGGSSCSSSAVRQLHARQTSMVDLVSSLADNRLSINCLAQPLAPLGCRDVSAGTCCLPVERLNCHLPASAT